ncbi:MAG: APC family permease [Acidobacteriia bacterium]|nr:APC family permease [Terriglobia bacterium]
MSVAENPNLKRPAIPVFIATTVMLSFISFWRVAAVVLADLASSAYYVGGDAEKVIGRSAPWFILAVMLFSYAVRAVYIESSAMFVRGGVYRVVKRSLGAPLAKLSVSALLFDYILTGPISAVSAGQYLGGFIEDISTYAGHPAKFNENYFAAAFAVLVCVYFWWKNIQGMHESSEKAMQIMKITTVMVVILIVWSLVTIVIRGAHLPPLPSHSNFKMDKEAWGWLTGTWAQRLTWLIVLVGFGHSVLAMSGEETLAQVNREIESPKLKNLERAGLVIFLYSLLFTGLVSFFAVMIIPDRVRPDYFANLIGGIAIYLAGPELPKLIFHGFVVLVGVLILAGALNTSIVGANGVLNRIAEDGVLTPWFQRPQRRYGTSFRIINLIVGLQIFTIVASRGNVYLLAALYAFGVIWSFSFNSLAVLRLRYTQPEAREFKVPGNLRLGGREVPVGLVVIGLVLFATAIVNLFTKQEATIAGVAFSLVFFGIFTFSERYTLRQQHGKHAALEQFRVFADPELDNQQVRARPGNVLVPVRDPSLYYLRDILHRTECNKQDVVVMTARLSPREHSFSGNRMYEAKEIFDTYEQELFSRVVAVAEKEGKPVSLLVVPGTDVFDTIMLTAQRLDSAKIVCGLSTKLTSDEQAKLIGDAWERLPEPKPRVTLEIIAPDGSRKEYLLGPHTPRLRDEDLALLHNLWLQLTNDPRYAGLHHYDVIGLALKELERELTGPERERLTALLVQELDKRAGGSPPN